MMQEPTGVAHLVGLDRHPYHGLVPGVEGPVSDLAGRLEVALTVT